MDGRTLGNRFAYIPPQCFTKTRRPGAAASNPCYACHAKPTAPNFTDDSDLQLALSLPPAAARNPWRNVLDPPVAHVARAGDAEVLGAVRRSNYFDERGEIALVSRLRPLVPAWDATGDHRWDGFVPDAWFRFDERGFDRRPDGAPSGWRAFAYFPFLGTFFPTNGSSDDVLIRLDPALREDAAGRPDARVYEVNLAIVEALITRRDVPVAGVDEAALGADLDLDGTLGSADRVAYDPRRMRYVGRAALPEHAPDFPAVPGLYPPGTEFLHSVRYLDVAADGRVAMASRMKELRYMKKARWLSPADLKARAAADVVEQAESANGAREVVWEIDRGVYNGLGWLLQGFIEAEDGALRPQSYEETVYCAGCHGGLGVTTDSTFAFARKLGPRSRGGGWFHASPGDLAGLPDPRRLDGANEYALYLRQNGAGDELRGNGEVIARFYDGRGRLREDPLNRLRADVSLLLVPSAPRALDLDRAYLAVVHEQSFSLGREIVLGTPENVYRDAPTGARTGVRAALAASPLAAEPEASPAAARR